MQMCETKESLSCYGYSKDNEHSYNFHVEFANSLFHMITRENTEANYWHCILTHFPTPLLCCQFIVMRGRTEEATEECSSGIANASNWCRKVYFSSRNGDDIFGMFALLPHCAEARYLHCHTQCTVKASCSTRSQRIPLPNGCDTHNTGGTHSKNHKSL